MSHKVENRGFFLNLCKKLRKNLAVSEKKGNFASDYKDNLRIAYSAREGPRTSYCTLKRTKVGSHP